MAIKIKKDDCIGCGSCAAVCDKIFQMNNEEMKAEVIDAEADDECVKEARDICPTQAIVIE